MCHRFHCVSCKKDFFSASHLENILNKNCNCGYPLIEIEAPNNNLTPANIQEWGSPNSLQPATASVACKSAETK
jgi:hypothetical protein